jgi:hypothetical protein
MSSAEMSLYAAIASAIAALLSSIITILAWRVARKNLHADVRPVLKLNYNFGDKTLKLENTGSGPALNIRLQKTQLHFVDVRRIIRYRIPTSQGHTLYHADRGEFEIIADKPAKDDDLALQLKDLGLFRYIDNIGKNKEIAIIYDDIYGLSFLMKIKMIELEDRKYVADVLSIKPYGLLHALWDAAHHIFFRSTKIIREWKYILSQK